MPNIDVCLSPQLIGQYGAEGKIVVVVDILRATSCMVTAFANGVTCILPVETVEECAEFKTKGHLTAAEREGKIVDGFEIGNSPFSYLQPNIKGQTIGITTTNGTKAIKLSAAAEQILIGAFLNKTVIAQYLLAQNKDVLIVCAGWKNKMNLEDTLFAGALVSLLETSFISVNDSAVASKVLYEAAKNNLFAFVTQNSSHYKRLKNLNLDKDIAFCLQQDIYQVIPTMKGSEMVAMQLTAANSK